MITKQEIEEKADEFAIHVSNVERDYVFGWLLKLIYENAYLSDLLILKGGNGLRKAFFPETRFSKDLDFSTQAELNLPQVRTEINNVCRQGREICGVKFETDRNTLEEDRKIDDKKKVYKGKVYFKDFYGNEDNITISIRLDITEFDRLYLDPVTRDLIHPYSDSANCVATVRCIALEELMANKLKCLIQRRHSHDLYDFIYAMFFEPPREVRRDLVVSTFLKKTIFERSPGAAKEILLGIPLAFFRGVWTKYIVCPVRSRLDFDAVERGFLETIEQLFAPFGVGQMTAAFVPAPFRNPILEAGAERKLLRITYDDIVREVEPYSLAYKRRQDGKAYEYFYAYDRTGGDSGPGIKAFLPFRIQDVKKTETDFEPQFEVELSKAGEPANRGYFGGSRFGSRGRRPSRVVRSTSARGFGAYGASFTVECSFCGKRFKRKTRNTRLKPHKDKNGWPCSGRSGYLIY